jgi:hypothetical protein
VAVCAVKYEPVSTLNSLIRAVLQGNFAKNCLFRQSSPDFGSDDQRLSGEFPTLANREFLREIRDSSFRISELLPEIREVPIPLNRGHKFARAAFQPRRLRAFDFAF